ncbi:MAG TPA: penicillin acylase family protein [Opitutaceae bacterium]|nr:penicillin acylase family protein [Opitutaceae bacterium]
MVHFARRIVRRIAVILLVGVLFVGVGAALVYQLLRGSLPQLEGQSAVLGLRGPVQVTRDALGVPTIRGASRGDVAAALGFLHAQERFFQMDIARRMPSGRLAELLGPDAIHRDRDTRVHGFGALARTVYARLPVEDRALLDGYRDGVNSGLAGLKARPAEYLLLRAQPEPWSSEDSLLVTYGMAINLQGSLWRDEKSLALLHERLGPKMASFFAPAGSEWDAALDGSHTPPPLPPDALEIEPVWRQLFGHSFPARTRRIGTPLDSGSNSFALGGARTETGSALLAGDMHVSLQVPNTWYRALMIWPTAGGERRVVGITVPGLPVTIAGSNGDIAWNFTNSRADCSDLVIVERLASDAIQYRTEQGTTARLESRVEIIAVRNQPAVTQVNAWTKWGPVVATDWKGRLLALRWTMHDADAANLNLAQLEETTNVHDALRIAKSCGIPALNILVIDRAGNLGWTICGKLPRRMGGDGQMPASWADGEQRWDGFRRPEEVPEIVNPATGQLWTANNRLVGGAALDVVGRGPYEGGARAKQIADGLAQLKKAKPVDLLAIQLDDRAVFLERWQQCLLATLTPVTLEGHSARNELRRIVAEWGGRAGVKSAGYSLVKQWRARVIENIYAPINASCQRFDSGFDVGRFDVESVAWWLIEHKPDELLNRRYSSWPALLLRAADDVIEDARRQGGELHAMAWGRINTPKIVHPLAASLPAFIAQRLNMPFTPLPGDRDMPRVQGVSYGASQRMVVSPGREADGIFEMPCGQSGHPLSEYYRGEHQAWMEGKPTPLLPGAPAHLLQLEPRPR